jgi:hypothetical protein
MRNGVTPGGFFKASAVAVEIKHIEPYAITSRRKNREIRRILDCLQLSF